jgi:hypothetical protein
LFSAKASVFGNVKPFCPSGVLKHSSLIGLKAYITVVQTPGTVFTTLHFPLNLQMGPIKQVVTINQAKQTIFAVTYTLAYRERL